MLGYCSSLGSADSAACCAESVAADVALVWHNCQQYNQPESAIDQLRAKAQQAFEQAWAKAGLPVASSAAAGQASAPALSKTRPEVCKLPISRTGCAHISLLACESG